MNVPYGGFPIIEYQSREDKLYPTAIVLTNYRYGYRLIVRQKEIRS